MKRPLSLLAFCSLLIPAIALGDGKNSVTTADSPDTQALAIYKHATTVGEINTPLPKKSLKNLVRAVLKLNTPFDHKERTMVEGKVKLVHGGDKDQAAVGVLRFVPAANNGLNGFLGDGGLVVARASATFPGRKGSFGPGMSIMRPGQNGDRDLNGFFLQSILGQGKNRNYFENSLSNDVRPKKPLARVAFEVLQSPIRLITWRPRTSPLGQSIGFIRADHLATDFDANGESIRDTGKKPITVIKLQPTTAAKGLIAPNTKDSLAKSLSTVAVGTRTHQVVADGKVVGHFEVARPFVGTQHRLHVRHPRGRVGSRFNRRK